MRPLTAKQDVLRDILPPISEEQCTLTRQPIFEEQEVPLDQTRCMLTCRRLPDPGLLIRVGRITRPLSRCKLTSRRLPIGMNYFRPGFLIRPIYRPLSSNDLGHADLPARFGRTRPISRMRHFPDPFRTNKSYPPEATFVHADYPSTSRSESGPLPDDKELSSQATLCTLTSRRLAVELN
ncbi:hypothetical protein DPMN_153185 [Dreissena polymorpha]|uniref:Uncharacterized protein n=1 Tax=Dreissena polymorpha TaxID=45954 RepID=A0A9D4FL20_DREPO|nr:hypothetical protein DPMN_153185 [Dreissena polymorpha]